MRAPAAAIVLLACCGSAAEPSERLLAQPPAGWVRDETLEQGSLRLTEFTPPGETSGRWRAKVSFEAISAGTDGTPLPEPQALLEELASDQEGACDAHSGDIIFAGAENGYPTAVSLLLCEGRRPGGTNQVALVKAIRGAERLYVVSRAERFAPGTGTPLEARVAEIALYLKAITVCDPDAPAHPCPAGAPDG